MTQIALTRLLGNEPNPHERRHRPSLRRRTIERRIRGACIALAMMVTLAVTVMTLMWNGAGTSHAAPSNQAATVIQLTNAERAKFGAGPLQHSDALARVAQDWAKHLADTDTFEHHDNGPLIPKGWSSWGENIAYNYDTDPAAMHQQWVKSEGHHKNMVNGAFNVMGLGWYQRADGRIYGVEVFATYENPALAGAEPVGGAPVAKKAAAPERRVTTPAATKKVTPSPLVSKSPSSTPSAKATPSKKATPVKKAAPRATATPVRSKSPTSATPSTEPSSATPTATPSSESGGGLPATGGFGGGAMPKLLLGSSGLGVLLIAGWAMFGARSKSRPR